MPYLFLSPSTQTFNEYVTSGNEQYWMNRVADAMEPYLRASGVNFVRNDPNGSAAQSIRDSNAGSYDFHLALHSNAAGAGNAGAVRGIDVYYYPTSREGLAMANIIRDNLQTLYPLPEQVRALTSTAIGELRRTSAPAVLAELGYHDNPEDAQWIEANVEAMGRNLALSVTEYFGLPFTEPIPPQSGIVVTDSGGLNLRAYPDAAAEIYRVIPAEEAVELTGIYDGWYTAVYDGITGFVRQEYIQAAP